MPPTAAFADVVALAGGVAVVAARAQERVAGGDAVTAIYLSEMALAAEPGSRVALEAHLASWRTSRASRRS